MQETAKLSIIEIISMEGTACGFRKYDFSTENGKVDVVRGYYRFDGDGNLLHEDTVRYPADVWQYTEEGYLIFEGCYFADDYYIISLTDEAEHTALRVAPLDAGYRSCIKNTFSLSVTRTMICFLSTGARRTALALETWISTIF